MVVAARRAGTLRLWTPLDLFVFDPTTNRFEVSLVTLTGEKGFGTAVLTQRNRT